MRASSLAEWESSGGLPVQIMWGINSGDCGGAPLGGLRSVCGQQCIGGGDFIGSVRKMRNWLIS